MSALALLKSSANTWGKGFALAITVMMLQTPYAWAQSQEAGWHGKTPHPAAIAKEVVPQPGSEEAYLERYTIRVNVDGGGWIGADLTLSNLGFGDGHGAADMSVQLQGDKKYRKVSKVGKDKWSTENDKLNLKIAHTTLSAIDHNTYALNHDDGEVKVQLQFKNTLPIWAPGAGTINVKDGYFKYHILSPRASVSGKVFKDGKWHDIKATANAFIDHTATNIAPYDFAKRFSRFSDYKDDVTVIWREVQLDERFGGQTLTWVLVGYKDQIVLQDAQAKLRFGKTQQDMTTGYTVPFAVQVDGKQGKDMVKLVMRGKRMKKKDLLESYGSAAKLVASAVSKPFRYSFDCKYILQMTIQGVTATIKDNGNYTIDFVNP